MQSIDFCKIARMKREACEVYNLFVFMETHYRKIGHYEQAEKFRKASIKKKHEFIHLRDLSTYLKSPTDKYI